VAPAHSQRVEGCNAACSERDCAEMPKSIIIDNTEL